MAGDDWFNPAAFFILLRETLEAAVIVAILLRFMDKTGHLDMKRQVWLGSLAGVVLSIIVGAIFMTIFYVAKNNIFSGDAEKGFKGVITIIAAMLITVLAFAMVKMITWEKKFEQKLKDATTKAVSGESKYAVFLLAFSAVFREGIESVLFLTGVSGNSTVESIILPGVLGVAIGLAVGWAVYFSSKPLKLKWFYYSSMFILLVIAAGLSSQGILFLSEAGWFGYWLPRNERNWFLRSAWDISSCCDDHDNGFWAMMRAVFGFEDKPTHGQILFWVGYWLIAVSMLYLRWKHLDGSDKLQAEDGEGSDEGVDVEVGNDNDKPVEEGKVEGGKPYPAGKEGGAAEVAAVPLPDFTKGEDDESRTLAPAA